METTNNIQETICKNLKDKTYDVVAYLDYKVLIGKLNIILDKEIKENKEVKYFFYKDETFEDEFIQKMRVFNEEEEELLFIRSNDGFRYRYKIDDKKIKDEKLFVDAEQVLFGTKLELLENNFIRLVEDRGTEIILPNNNFTVDDKKNRVAILTRNYFDYNELSQATFVDCRFVKFIPANKNKQNGDEQNG